MKPFTLIPAMGTIKPNSEYQIKIQFQPDHPSNNYFDVLLVDIPNQVQAKNVYLRGWCYSRQVFVREHEPFEWKTTEKLKKRYEDPLKMLAAVPSIPPGGRQRIVLEYIRDEDIDLHDDKVTAFEREKNRVRKICIGNCRMQDPKMEKNGAYEITPAVILFMFS